MKKPENIKKIKEEYNNKKRNNLQLNTLIKQF